MNDINDEVQKPPAKKSGTVKARYTTMKPTMPVYDDEILNWDVYIATPPPRASGTIKVKLKYIGRAKPKFFDDDPIIIDD